MIRITKSHSAIEAEKYFDLALKTSDYYAKEQGTWGGKGAERLGLKGKVERKDFVSLAGNKVPGTGKRLTLRKNTTREEKLRDKETGIPILDTETGQPITTQVSNRRAGYDFTFSVPKSVSLYLAVNGDKVVEELIGEALDQTMTGKSSPTRSFGFGQRETGGASHSLVSAPVVPAFLCVGRFTFGYS